MITIVFSTHKDSDYNKTFREHLLRYVGLKNIQILEYQNNNEFSLAEIYNRGISESEHDIVVCVHNDIKLNNDWGKKLLNDFNNNPEYGIIGKAGSCSFPKTGVYWENINETMVGQVYHQPDKNNKWVSKYSAKSKTLIPVVTIDGLFIAFNKHKIKHKFDESLGGFHFYDHGFTLPNFLNGVKIGVTSSFDITHQSVGKPNEEFFKIKEEFIKKYGEKLPIDFKPQQINVPKIEKIKNKNKVAIIIPTKGKINLVKDCVNSFIEHCDHTYFNIFIADTGSDDDEKIELKNYILENQSIIPIHLIEYDYYNFAKINNDVVKNHINDDFKFLLFCNNDIKILNDVISGMIDVFMKYPKSGTVGARLHFADNTIQHEGILTILNQHGKYDITHIGIRSYYNKNNGVNKVSGNTGALMMIRKNTFINCGYFNENYSTCFEDVELNYKCLCMGLENYCNSDLVAYHYESQTRKEDNDDLIKLQNDYINHLRPFFTNNYNKLLPYVTHIRV